MELERRQDRRTAGRLFCPAGGRSSRWYFVTIARERGFYSDDLMSEVMKRGNLRGMTGIPADIKRLFRTALEIPAKDHIEMQAAF